MDFRFIYGFQIHLFDSRIIYGFKIHPRIPDLSMDTRFIYGYQIHLWIPNSSMDFIFIYGFQIHLWNSDSSIYFRFPDLRYIDRFQIYSLILDLSLDSRLVVIFLKGRPLLYILALRAVYAFIPLQGSTQFLYRVVHSSFTG